MKWHIVFIFEVVLALSLIFIIKSPCQAGFFGASSDDITDAMSIIKKSYVSEVSTSQLSDAAIRGIEKVCGETYIKPEINDNSSSMVAIDNKSIEMVNDAYAICKRKHPAIGDKDIIYSAISNMVFSLDPQSSFTLQDYYKDEIIDHRSAFSGVGLEITINKGILTVICPHEDTPAFKAGIKNGDQIIKIDEKLTKYDALEKAIV